MNPECVLAASKNKEIVSLSFAGNWTIHERNCPTPDLSLFVGKDTKGISFESHDLKEWDSRFLVELTRIIKQAKAKAISVDTKGLPPGVRRLLRLSTGQPLGLPRHGSAHSGIFTGIGNYSLDFIKQGGEMLTFTGEISLSYLRFLRGQARYLGKDLTFFLYDCGPSALPIVSLISFLVGFTLAFIGAVQLKMFGADIYVANLVGLTMTREMGPMMAAIIMAGRTGASYAAQLGTMQVNEEIDALQTMGLDPLDFLVLPRMTSLIIMMPLLAIYADFIGILGGFFIGCFSLDISPLLYYQQTLKAVTLNHFLVGLTKATVFGYLVAFCGCLKGMYCGRSADAVGKATTSAVVTAIIFIVISDAGFTFFFNVLGI